MHWIAELCREEFDAFFDEAKRSNAAKFAAGRTPLYSVEVLCWDLRLHFTFVLLGRHPSRACMGRMHQIFFFPFSSNFALSLVLTLFVTQFKVYIMLV